MEFLFAIGVFAAKAAIILFVLVVLIVLIATLVAKAKLKPELEVEILNHKLNQSSFSLQELTLTKESFKKYKKQEKEFEEKFNERPRLFVLNFKGDVQADQVEQLSQEISTILLVAKDKDETLLKLESPGGVVHGYGLAAAQLLRFRSQNVPLTICVDKVAASGGYMMACTGSKILAAPFAILGSIGVYAGLPNFNRLLKKHAVDYKEYTAGEYKRTVSILGEITEKGEEKFKSDMEETHLLFKDFVHEYRPQLDMKVIGTGETFYGKKAMKLGLIDGISTSDDYILSKINSHQLVQIKLNKKQKLSDKISHLMSMGIRRGLRDLVGDLEAPRGY